MKPQTAACVRHIAVGFAAVIVGFTSVLVDVRPLFLFLVGIPWFAGFLAFYGLPRTAFVWTLPVIPLLLGLMIWLLAVGLSDLGN
jgi:hypothetical protein